MMTLAEWIEAEGISRKEAAERLQISPSYLTELCRRDGRNPSLELALRIHAATDGKVSLSELARV